MRTGCASGGRPVLNETDTSPESAAGTSAAASRARAGRPITMSDLVEELVARPYELPARHEEFSRVIRGILQGGVALPAAGPDLALAPGSEQLQQPERQMPSLPLRRRGKHLPFVEESRRMRGYEGARAPPRAERRQATRARRRAGNSSVPEPSPAFVLARAPRRGVRRFERPINESRLARPTLGSRTPSSRSTGGRGTRLTRRRGSAGRGHTRSSPRNERLASCGRAGLGDKHVCGGYGSSTTPPAQNHSLDVARSNPRETVAG